MNTLDTSSSRQRGVTLIVVLILLVVVTVLGIGGARIALLSERSTRFDRDHQVAWQAAEAALIDAEYDIAGPNASTNQRLVSFRSETIGNYFPESGCGTTHGNRGLCQRVDPNVTASQIWQTVDFMNETTSAPTVAFGTKTGFTFMAGPSGVQPRRVPRYMIEWTDDRRGGNSAELTGHETPPVIIFRITSIGFGPNDQVQVMMQSSFAR